MHPIEKLKPKPMVPFTADRKQQYLDLFRSHERFGGRKYLCGEAVGVSASTVDYHIKNDPEFAQAFEDARQCWIDEHLVTALLQRAVTGVEKPLLGGRFKDEVVAYERVYSDSLLALELRARRPEYRDAKEAAMAASGTGGVLIVPGAPETVSDWQNAFGDLARGTVGRPTGEKGA